MRSLILVLMVLAILAACTPVDACTADPHLPECQTRQAGAQATIAAISMGQASVERSATQQARQAEIAVRAQATQAAIVIQATQVAVNMAATSSVGEVMAEATKDAIEVDALKRSAAISATIAAIAVETAKIKASNELSTTALIGQAQVTQSQMEAATATPRAALGLGLVSFVVAVIAISIALAIRQSANAVAHAAMLKASFRTYGINNNRAVLVLPGPDGKMHITPIDDLIGDHLLSDGSGGVLDALEISDQDRLRAYIEQAKRRKIVEIAAVAGTWPEIDEPAPPAMAAPLVGQHYQIVAPGEQPKLLAGIPQAVDVIDAEWRKMELTV